MTAELEREVADKLIEAGVDTAFGIMGMGNLYFISELCARGIRYVSARHEDSSVAMADAWARATARVGIASVTRGPGLTNSITALVEAEKSRVPLVLFVGETADPAHPQNWDHRSLIEGAGIEFFHLDEGDVSGSTVRALEYAAEIRRPIVIELRTGSEGRSVPRLTAPRASVAIDETTVAEIATKLRTARRPVILAGRGAVEANARSALEELAAQSGALLATTAMANGMFSGNPRYVGVSGGFSSAETVAELSQADVVVAFGASLNQWTLRHGWLYTSVESLVQVDIDDAAFGKRTKVDVSLRGDARDAAESILASLGEASREVASDWPDSRPTSPVVELVESAAGLDPDVVSRLIAGMLPTQRSVAVDSGHFFGFAVRHFRPDNARAWVFSQAFLSLGLGIASGIGAAAARPDVLTVAVCGDGGTLMSVGEIDTAVRSELPLLIVILNDAGYGAEVHELRHVGLPESVAQFNDVDFAVVARGLGAEGLTIRRYAELDGLASWLEAPNGTMVLDCKVDPAILADWAQEQYERSPHSH